MRITEMQQREPFVEILTGTLSQGWSEQYATSVRVIPAEKRVGDVWKMQPLLNACYHQPLGWKARDFLRDGFRHTPVVWRRPAQWLIGTVLASSYGLKRWSESVFQVIQGPVEINRLLVMPGNQRVRVFDFQTNTSRVLLKAGFEPGGMLREIQIRGTAIAADGPFLPMTDWAEGGDWFEEPLIRGFTLPRCPANLPRARYEQRARVALSEWLDNTTRSVEAREWIASLHQKLTDLIACNATRYPRFEREAIQRVVEVLIRQAQTLERIEVAQSHGDFQPGNVLIEPQTDRVYLIDCEYSEYRLKQYDFWVYELRSRWPSGLANRLIAFVRGGCQTRGGEAFSRSECRAQLSLFLLEDLVWLLATSIAGPFNTLPASLDIYCRELLALGPDLAELFGGTE